MSGRYCNRARKQSPGREKVWRGICAGERASEALQGEGREKEGRSSGFGFEKETGDLERLDLLQEEQLLVLCTRTESDGNGSVSTLPSPRGTNTS